MGIKTIQIGQIIVSLLLIISILLQSKGSSTGGVFGGTNEIYRAKRGVEKILFRATIVLAVLFIGLAVAGLLISSKQLS